jgi:hypothetical protein
MGTSWFVWRIDFLFRPQRLQLNQNCVGREQRIKSVTGSLNTWIDKTTLAVMGGLGWWNQEQARTTNNDNAPPPHTHTPTLPRDRILPISCSSYCNRSDHCLHKAVVLIHYVWNAVKYIIKNIITLHPLGGSLYQNNFHQLIPSCHSRKSYNLPVMESVHLLRGSFSRTSRSVACWFTGRRHEQNKHMSKHATMTMERRMTTHHNPLTEAIRTCFLPG